MENNITLSAAAEMLAGSENLLILAHEHPDGDTLGCAFALKHAFSGEGRRVEVACCDPVRPTLAFISGAEDLAVPEDFEPDLVCTVDVAAVSMLGGLYEKYRDRLKLKIDHHRTSELFAEYYYVDDTAAACGEIIFRMLKGCGRLNKPVCDALYAAIASDTGSFKFGNSTADSHRISAELMDLGADFKYVNRMLFEQRTPGELAAQRAALAGLRFYAGGRIAAVGFTNEMMERDGFDEDDIAPLHSLPREIMGVEMGITIRQTEADPGLYKISTRSSGEPDCSAVCAVFGGGGHKGAAGCKIRAASLGEAERLIVAEAEKALS